MNEASRFHVNRPQRRERLLNLAATRKISCQSDALEQPAERLAGDAEASDSDLSQSEPDQA